MKGGDFAARSIDLEEVRIHYAEAVSPGPPMVLLHGIGVDWRVWQSIGRRLRRHFHLFAPDLRGHGKSSKPRSGYSLADYAGDVEQLLEQLQLEEVTLVGSSLGGLIATVVETSVRAVSSRILVDPPLTLRPAASRRLFLKLLEIKAEGTEQAEQQRRLAEALVQDNPGIGRLQLQYMTETWKAVPAGVLEEMLAESEDGWLPRLMPHLESIESPVLIMRANPRLGGVLTEEAASMAVGALPDGHLEYFERAGHAIHGSRPVEFVQAVLDFAQPRIHSGSVAHGSRG